MDNSRKRGEPPGTSLLASSRPTSSKRSESFCRRWRMESFIERYVAGEPGKTWGAAFSGMSALCDKVRHARSARRLYSGWRENTQPRTTDSHDARRQPDGGTGRLRQHAQQGEGPGSQG